MNRTLRSIAADRQGFTLIEIIVTIIITAVLATILVQVMANQTSRSYEPLQIIDENLALQAAMDNIASDYRYLRETNAAPLITLQQRITGGGYWQGKPYVNGVAISATTGCTGFDAATGIEDPGLGNATCTTDDRILKVTLAVSGTRHQLAALFTR